MAPRLLLLLLALRATVARAQGLGDDEVCCFKPALVGRYQAGHHDISVKFEGGHPLVSGMGECRQLCCQHGCASLDVVEVQEKFRCYLSSVAVQDGVPGATLKIAMGASYQEWTKCTTTVTATTTTVTTTEAPWDDPRLTELEDLEPVYDFWNFNDQDHTFHMDEARDGESMGHLQFYAFRHAHLKSQSIYNFRDTLRGENRLHAGEAGANEEKGERQFYALAKKVPGTEPVYNFWHSAHQEFTHHLDPPWGGEERRDLLFYAFPDKTECWFDCVKNRSCDVSHFRMDTDWRYYSNGAPGSLALTRHEHLTTDDCKVACGQTAECFGVDVKNDSHCLFWLTDSCNVAQGDNNRGWKESDAVTCTKGCQVVGATSTTTFTLTSTTITTTITTLTITTTTTGRYCQPGYFSILNGECQRCQPGATRRRRATSCSKCERGTYDSGDFDDCAPLTTTPYDIYSPDKWRTTTQPLAPVTHGQACTNYECPEGWSKSLRRWNATCWSSRCTFVECCRPHTETRTTTTTSTVTTHTTSTHTTTTSTSTHTTVPWKGEHSSTTATTTQVDCPPGHFPIGGEECHVCFPGSVRRRSRRNPVYCTECPTGRYDAGDFDDCLAGTTTATSLAPTPPSGVDWVTTTYLLPPNPCEPFKWERIASQKITDDNSSLFSAEASYTLVMNEHHPSANPFMLIGKVNASSPKVRPNGHYHFRLVYDGEVSVEWRQTSWLTQGNVEGFECSMPMDCGPSSAMSGTRFEGLSKSSAGHWSIFDGDGSRHWQWFNSVGTLRKYKGGIPGWNGKIYQSMELFLGHCQGWTVTADAAAVDEKASAGHVSTGGAFASVRAAALAALGLAALVGAFAGATVLRRKSSSSLGPFWRPRGSIARAPPQRASAHSQRLGDYAVPGEQPDFDAGARGEMRQQLIE